MACFRTQATQWFSWTLPNQMSEINQHFTSEEAILIFKALRRCFHPNLSDAEIHCFCLAGLNAEMLVKVTAS
jgi:hypothetical protein